MPRTWIEVSRSLLQSNLTQIQDLIGTRTILGAVVKANAYGHGIDLVSGVLSELDVRFFCVDSLEEALTLLSQGITAPILIMGYVPPEDFHRLEDPMRLCVYSQKSLDLLEELHKSLKIHMKIETGLNRQGISGENVPNLLKKLEASPALSLEGVYTHYANVEDTLSSEFYKLQFVRFQEYTHSISPAVLRHSCASAAALLYPDATQDLVRVGIALYGYYSSWQTLLSLKERQRKVDLHPILTWKTRIAQVKRIQKGDRVGYGCTHEALRKGKIAILPVGYYDGYDRRNGSQTHVLIRSTRAPVIGRVAMNMIVVDVSHIPGVNSGDEVVLLGSQGRVSIAAEELAEAAGTIHYEVLTRISSHLPRVLAD
ncbi:alanine racemase [bacterium]|nr:alanine racemase [bacterium]